AGILRRLGAPPAGSALQEIGYSAAGIVVAQGEAVSFPIGTRVACAGSQFAHHAEVISVPENLLARIPDGVSFEQAAFSTLGAIALHGFRRTGAGLGESIAVVGLGLVGLLGAQVARAAGCGVIAFDPDPGRVELAGALGLGNARRLGEVDAAAETRAFTAGAGVDAVLIFAATPSDEPLALAMDLARRKGKVVVVGDVGMRVDRSRMYEKELDLLISTSYGPGRYDPTYEESGLDYPLPYVRWTEGRNLSAFLELLASDKVRVEPLIERIFPVAQAQAAYASLKGSLRRPAVLLSFPAKTGEDPRRLARSVRLSSPKPLSSGAVKAAVVGPGSFMRERFLPEFRREKVGEIEAVVSGSGGSARSAAEALGASVASTDLEEILSDPILRLVVIGTRHHLHGQQVEQALLAGKSVFVEKPLCLTRGELDRIREARERSGALLAVGFNRRYAPLIGEMKQRLSRLAGPRMVQVRVNAGRLPADHWTQQPEIGGGRLVGEGCHFLDLAPFLVGSPIVSLQLERAGPGADPIPFPDSFVLSLRFADGSAGSLVYTSLGDASLGKERIEVHACGASLVLEDFEELRIHQGGKPRTISRTMDKGIVQEIRELKAALQGKPSSLISWEEIEAATLWTLHAQDLLEGRG
ncbi:MAG TPA: bi-domain-containing oxidoreductase, partial [Candidatus Polarisedimenticolia bacterium]|nr:bi-domain-containing oxidoreductase [Candidatus Polarisedimenticolia bacterium]